MSSFRVCPGEKVGETRMEFDYYFDDGKGGTEGFEEYFKFVRKVALEDFELCEVAQNNLERGVYSQGVLNQVKESGVLRKFLPHSDLPLFPCRCMYIIQTHAGSSMLWFSFLLMVCLHKSFLSPWGFSSDILSASKSDYQQLTRKMVVEQFKEEEANRNALTPASSRASDVGRADRSGEVSVSA